jgi:pilus assembly protein Flp/PilA
MLVDIDFLARYLRARVGSDDSGASLVEYALLVALIAIVCLAAITILGGNADSNFSTVANSIGT